MLDHWSILIADKTSIPADMEQLVIGRELPNLKITLAGLETTNSSSNVETDIMEVDEEPDNDKTNEEDEDGPNVKIDVKLEFMSYKGMKRYENKLGSLITGLDLASEEFQERLEKRAKRFQIESRKKSKITQEDVDALYKSLNINTANDKSEKSRGIRLDAVHIRGVSDMSTEDIFAYFGEYGPSSIEWINDVSCNVVWLDESSAARALLGLSRPLILHRRKRSLTEENDVTIHSQDAEDEEKYIEGGEEVVMMSEDESSDDESMAVDNSDQQDNDNSSSITNNNEENAVTSIATATSTTTTDTCAASSPLSTTPQEDPVTTQEDPVTAQEDPVAIQDDPVTIQEDSVTVQEDPVTVQEDPVTVQEDPVTVQEDTVTVQEDPVTAQEDPVTAQEDPVTAKEDPVTAKEDPVTAKEDPVAAQEDPITIQEDPIITEEDPVSTTQEDPVTTTITTTTTATIPECSATTTPPESPITTTQEDKDIELEVKVDEELPLSVPPGYWRLGVPHPKAKVLLLRFATKDDKKIRGAEKRSVYYKKYGNPNYGGMKGLISNSRKRRFWQIQQKRELQELGIKNNTISDVGVQNNFKRMETSSSESENEPDDVLKPLRRKLRMKMYADEEEDKQKNKRLRLLRYSRNDGRIVTRKKLLHSVMIDDSDDSLDDQNDMVADHLHNSGYSVWERLTNLNKNISAEYEETSDLRNKLQSRVSGVEEWTRRPVAPIIGDLRSKLDRIRSKQYVREHRSPLFIRVANDQTD